MLFLSEGAILGMSFLLFLPTFMSCCPPSGPGCQSAGFSSKYTGYLPRIGFGLVLFSYGVNHYRHLDGFIAGAKAAFPTVPALATVSGILAYIVPALMIVGGALFATRQLCGISKLCVLGALSGILGWASLAVLVGDANAGGSSMPMIQSAAVLLILYFSVKKSCCKPMNCSDGSCK